MSTLRTCPKCQCKSLESDPVRVWCVYVKGCVFSFLHNSDEDAGQMTNSDEPTDTEEREEWSGTDWCLAWNSEPPGEDVSHECYKAQPNECANEVIDRLCADVKAGERHLQSLKDDAGDMLCDLEDQVKRLEAELHDSAKNVLSLSASLGKKIERVSELEAERGCPSCAHCQLKRGGHLG